ncbi:MAG: PIN domain-containing protein, partial [Acidimicrobiales bacterium]
AVDRGAAVLERLEIVRINDRILNAAGALQPAELRSVDAIHLATAQQLGDDLARVCTYDGRMADAATALGWRVVAPGRRGTVPGP